MENNGIKKITARAVIVGFIGAVFLCLVTPYCDLFVQTYLAQNSSVLGVIVLFIFLVLGVNTLLKLVSRKLGFSFEELIVIYLIMLVSATIPTLGLIYYIIPSTAAPLYYLVQPTDQFLKEMLIKWPIVQDESAVKYIYEGLPKGQDIPWSAWLKPFGMWALFVGGLYFGIVCLSVIIRKQWVEREKLIFPLLAVPMEMAKAEQGESILNSFFKNKFLWLGMAIAGSFHLINGIGHFSGLFKTFAIAFPVGKQFVERPLNAIQSTNFILDFCTIGFSYLVSLEVSFSIWFFYVLGQLESVFAVIIGWDTFNQGGYWYGREGLMYEGVGGAIIFAGFLLWSARAHLKDIVLKAFTVGSKVDDKNEIASYRLALIGFIASMVFITCWCVMMGMSPVVSLIIFILFFLIGIVITRLVAEAGVVYAQVAAMPFEVINSVVGTSVIPKQTIAGYSFMYLFMFDLGAFIMPNVLQGFKATSETKIKQRPVFWIVIATIIIAIVVSTYSFMLVSHKYGGLQLSNWAFKGSPTVALKYSQEPLNYPKGPNAPAMVAMAIGGGVVGFVMWLTRMLPAFRLNPIGIPMLGTYALQAIWASFLIGWFLKKIIIWLGGSRMFNQLKPLFLGLIIGQFLLAGVWSVVAFAIGKQGYSIFPW